MSRRRYPLWVDVTGWTLYVAVCGACAWATNDVVTWLRTDYWPAVERREAQRSS